MDRVLLINAAGSSPLTRGKRAAASAAPPMRGLIPAHAGKTKMTEALTVGPPAHPRSRGENRDIIERRADSGGSSPLTRGKLQGAGEAALDRGLIPAHAGKTGVPSFVPKEGWAHPRSRGENIDKAVQGK